MAQNGGFSVQATFLYLPQGLPLQGLFVEGITVLLTNRRCRPTAFASTSAHNRDLNLTWKVLIADMCYAMYRVYLTAPVICNIAYIHLLY